MSRHRILLVAAALLCVSVVAFSQAHTRLYSTLIDLPGWKGDSPEGMSMDMPGMKMVNAVRSYSRGGEELTATLVVGNEQMAQATKQAGSMNIETDKEKIVVKQIGGYTVQILFDKTDQSGSVIVILDEQKPVLFNLVFEGISDEEALGLAQRFDWNEMKSLGASL